MAKKGLKRPDRTHTQPRNQLEPVPEIQGKAKHAKEKAGAVNNGVGASGQMDYYRGRSISSDVYPVINTDLVRKNLENGIPVRQHYLKGRNLICLFVDLFLSKYYAATRQVGRDDL